MNGHKPVRHMESAIERADDPAAGARQRQAPVIKRSGQGKKAREGKEAVAVMKESVINAAAGKQPSKVLYLEDHVPGSVYSFGSIVVDEKAIIDFGTRYDPQTFHTDPEGAKKTSFGGLVASGWHTIALAMRLLVDHRLSHLASLGSPGVDEVRWLRPVRPGDKLSVRMTILEVRPSASKPDRGVIRVLVEVLNQVGEVVTSWKGTNIVLRENAG